MPDEGSDIKVLMQECEQANDAIHRFVGIIYALLGIVVPAVMTVLAAVLKETVKGTPVAVIGLILAGTYYISSLYAAALWVEVFGLMEFKYLHLMPHLYARVGITEKPNLGQSMAVYHTTTRWLPALLFNIVSLVFVTVAAWLTLENADAARFGMRAGLIAMATITLFVSSATWSNMKRVYGAIRSSHTLVSTKEDAA